MDVSKLEPADRDPKKLRATAFKLVIFMIFSGVFLTFAYNKYRERTSNSDRPSLLTKITEPDVELLTSDGKMRNLQDLKGQVTLAITLPSVPQPESQASLDALDAIFEAFKDKPEKPTILVFVLDGTNTEPEKMASVLAKYGKEPDVLRVAANADGKTSLRSFLKAKMRFNITPTEKDGNPLMTRAWFFSTNICMCGGIRALHMAGTLRRLRDSTGSMPRLRKSFRKRKSIPPCIRRRSSAQCWLIRSTTCMKILMRKDRNDR